MFINHIQNVIGVYKQVSSFERLEFLLLKSYYFANLKFTLTWFVAFLTDTGKFHSNRLLKGVKDLKGKGPQGKALASPGFMPPSYGLRP